MSMRKLLLICDAADMDVNYGHYMTTVLTNLTLHGERQ